MVERELQWERDVMQGEVVAVQEGDLREMECPDGGRILVVPEGMVETAVEELGAKVVEVEPLE
jgi:hypothetical protein